MFVLPSIGSQTVWDGVDWRILNLGETEVTLLNSSQNLINLSITVFEELISSGKITVISNKTLKQSKIYSEIIDASSSDCAEANRRYRIVAPYLIGSSPRNKNVPRSSFYRWIQSWREAEQTKGYGYLGLLPRNSKKGNRQPKLPALTQKLMGEYIANDYETYKQKGKSELPVPAYGIPKRSQLQKSRRSQKNIGSNTSHLSTLREQVIVNIRHRRLIVFLTDEAQRFSKMASSSRQQAQMDAMQSMASMTNTLHGLFGTYELLEFRNLSGQLSRRSIDIHFPRYQADCPEDLVESN